MRSNLVPTIVFFLLLIMSFLFREDLGNQWTWMKTTVYCFVSLLLATISFVSCKLLIKIVKTRGCSPRILFRGFSEKIWLTIGLALFFVSLFFFINFLIYHYMSKDLFLEHLAFGLQHPSYYFLWGGLSIYLQLSTHHLSKEYHQVYLYHE